MTGAIAPSSPWLAKALTAPLTRREAGSLPVEILEAGPGTGALTNAIVSHLRPGDHLTLCEINAGFVKHLTGRLEDCPKLAPYRDQVTIHHGPVEELGARDRFQHVVCGLPFNNFPPDLVSQIFGSLEEAVRGDGSVTFFEYAGLRSLKKRIVTDKERLRLHGVEAAIKQACSRYEGAERKLIRYNLPPAWAWTLSAKVGATKP